MITFSSSEELPRILSSQFDTKSLKFDLSSLSFVSKSSFGGMSVSVMNDLRMPQTLQHLAKEEDPRPRMLPPCDAAMF